ncbi:cytidylate kinase [Geothermobacter ehrlichii]|uniref:Cytidylate kinase n=1 Tax=Geothermobacter ehrlichii TaxID=213224 RepID=A0A5D3WM60_9BACT|nr:(d)CMP kinase [Geothermobacter ehrlichii]TYO99569.1 cytidylate kinase [Geothermobacter ehrlichii]
MTEVRRELIIAIDGPSGSGKSTLSRLLAERLGYLNIDTGAMYRSVALAASRAGIDPGEEERLAALCAGLDIRFRQNGDGGLRVLLNGEDVSGPIRQPAISRLTPRIASVPAVREALVAQQRRLGAEGGVVLEGRDIGSVVFPDADIKFYLFASAEERGRRRWLELKAKGFEVELDQTIREVEERDRTDMEREVAPLIRPEDAVDIDTGGLSIDEVLERLLAAVETIRRRRGLPPIKESCHA